MSTDNPTMRLYYDDLEKLCFGHTQGPDNLDYAEFGWHLDISVRQSLKSEGFEEAFEAVTDLSEFLKQQGGNTDEYIMVQADWMQALFAAHESFGNHILDRGEEKYQAALETDSERDGFYPGFAEDCDFYQGLRTIMLREKIPPYDQENHVGAMDHCINVVFKEYLEHAQTRRNDTERDVIAELAGMAENSGGKAQASPSLPRAKNLDEFLPQGFDELVKPEPVSASPPPPKEEQPDVIPDTPIYEEPELFDMDAPAGPDYAEPTFTERLGDKIGGVARKFRNAVGNGMIELQPRHLLALVAGFPSDGRITDMRYVTDAMHQVSHFLAKGDREFPVVPDYKDDGKTIPLNTLKISADYITKLLHDSSHLDTAINAYTDRAMDGDRDALKKAVALGAFRMGAHAIAAAFPKNFAAPITAESRRTSDRFKMLSLGAPAVSAEEYEDRLKTFDGDLHYFADMHGWFHRNTPGMHHG